jgi:hypothetical protein
MNETTKTTNRRSKRYGKLTRVSAWRTTDARIAAMTAYCERHNITRTELLERAVDAFMSADDA